MNVSLLLQVFFFGYCSCFFNLFESSKSVKVTPKTQTVHENEDVVIDCTDGYQGKVQWHRLQGPMPERATQHHGRLTIKQVKYENSGVYLCIGKDEHHVGEAFVEVIRSKKPVFPTNIWDTWEKTNLEYTTSTQHLSLTSRLPSTQHFSSTSRIPSTDGLLSRTSTPVPVNTPYPCLYGICNGTCCEINLEGSFFDCANGQKINKSLVCNRVNDCQDGSDESGCEPWPSKITVLPKDKVEVYCGEQDDDQTGTLILECQSVGHPTPVIRWKKYDGHVPTKCLQYSKRGHGILTCPNFQQSDQGAYSCVAENSVKSAESQPKSIAKCNNTINCRGFKVINEEQIEYCLDCYCSGRSSQCQNIKSNPTSIKIPFPKTKTEVFAKENGEIVFVPTKTNPSPDSKIRASAQEITFCSLSETDLAEKSFLKSFGRNVIFPRHKGKTDFLEKAPDLIIQGSGLSLMYTATLLSPHKGNMMDVSAKFWPGNWHHLNKKAASRKDLMKVLSNVESLLIRCEYKQGQTLSLNNTATIVIQSSTITDSTKSVSYVEKCNCPAGYAGLSCETCAAGYKEKAQGSGFICEKIYVPPPSCGEGYTGADCKDCDTRKGYYENGDACVKAVCNSEGATSVFLNIFKKCNCRERVTGEFCDRCEIGSFYLHKARGCLQCWCSGVTNECDSSKLYRTVISNTPRGGYNSSDGRNFWLLPSDFRGNRLTSYGGYLNYTMKYSPLIPKENTYLSVEFLSVDDVTLVYTHSTVDSSLSRDEKSWSVPLTEVNWRKSDRSPIARGEFLTVLSKIKAIYIESPYHLSSGKSNLTAVRMSSASPTGDGDGVLALEVEQCNCPRGYTGLSCERCSDGYYKKRNGTITQCIKCDCPYCDPDFGCSDCPQLTYRDNPESEKMPVCKSCPCNGNAISCVKDDFNQIFCHCKPGFTGMHCENTIPKKKGDLTISITPRITNGKKSGTTVFFNCSISSSEEMTLSVRKSFLKGTQNDSHILLGRGSKISEKFEVVLETGLQAVECYVHDSRGRVAGHVVGVVEDIITEIKPVRITNCYSDRLDVKESESKDIICEATGSPPPMVNWYKMQNGSSAEKVDTSEGVHTIEFASMKDNGTIYTCVAENSEGDKATCPRVLIVRKKCEVINIFPKDARMIEGENLSLHCTTTAKGPVVWSQLDTTFGRKKPIASPRIKVENSDLHIKNASVWDSGTYICSANGESGEINKTVVVSVEEKKVPPTVYIQEYDKKLRVGESFDVHCIVTGKPTPAVTWKKLNGSLGINVNAYGKTLSIRKATVQNSGIYVCKAHSVAGNGSSYISITVEQITIPPKLNISQEIIEAHEGEEVTLACLAIGYPRPRLNWYGQRINFTQTSSQINNMVLIEPRESIKEEIKFVVTKDMENLGITCYAVNSAGTDQKSCLIKVLHSRKRGINETVELVPIGSYFELQCEFDGPLEWKKVKGEFVGDECKVIHALMIPSVQVQHNGTYVCKDGSGSEKIINLIVVGFVPKFSRADRSYMVMPVQLKSPRDFRIELTFNSAHENGLLLQDENRLDVYLSNRKVHLRVFSTNGDHLDIVMGEPITLRRWYTLVIHIRDDLVDITIYNEKTLIHGRKTERSKDFNIDLKSGNLTFFISGSAPKGRHARRVFFERYPYFDGCISRLSIARHEFDIVKEASYSYNVSLCRKCSELQNPCGERGNCLDAPTQHGFICVCPNDRKLKNESCAESCAGKGCETQLDLCKLLNPCNRGIHKCIQNTNNMQCDCAFGYSGATCEKVQQYSFCARGDGYVKLRSMLLERHVAQPEIIRMSFTLQKPTGQLLWQGDQTNHLSIAVLEGKLRYVYLNQHSQLEIHTRKEIELNKKYTMYLKRINNTADLQLTSAANALSHEYRNFTNDFYTNRVTGDIYLGNAPNDTPYHGLHSGLNGCIHYISFGENAKVNFPEKEVEKVNVFQNTEPDTESDESVDYNAADSDSNEMNSGNSY